MTIKLHVGNISNDTREADLENLFNEVGLVMSVQIPKETNGNQKNFGFVNMGTESGAAAAIQALNGTTLLSRQISVRQAEAKE